MKTTKSRLRTLSTISNAIPFKVNEVRLATPTITSVILLRAEIDRHLQDLEATRRSILESSKEGVEGFDEGIMAYNESPEEHPEFEPILAQVDERFSPAINELLKEEVDLKRVLNEQNIADIVEMFASAGVDEIELPQLPYNKGETIWKTEQFIMVVAANLMD